MACIERLPRCGAAAGDAGTVATPLGNIWALLLIAGTIISVLGSTGTIKAIIAFLGTSAPVAGGFVAGVIALAIVFSYGMDRCNTIVCEQKCVSGVIHDITPPDFNAVVPYTAIHTRVDVIVKSAYWDTVEQNLAKVFCTESDPPRRSEILRCYYYTDKVCAVIVGAEIGAALGLIAGLALAAILLGACAALLILCIILAALLVAVAVFGGAALGGYIAGETSDPLQNPSDSNGTTLVTGALVSVTGNLCIRDEDEHANVFWWVSMTNPHGIISSSLTLPYSYCELEEELPEDTCNVIVIE